MGRLFMIYMESHKQNDF